VHAVYDSQSRLCHLGCECLTISLETYSLSLLGLKYTRYIVKDLHSVEITI